MAAAKKRRSPFAVDADGKHVYIRVRDSGIHPWVVMMDGLPITMFGKESAMYLRVEDAAAWHRKEYQESRGQSGSLEIAEGLDRVLEKFRAGNVNYV